MPRIALAERLDARAETTNPGIDPVIHRSRPDAIEVVVDPGFVDDAQFVEFCETFIPGDPASFADRIYIPTIRKKGWTRVAKNRPNVDALRLIRAHFDGGWFQKPQPIVGFRREIKAIGISFRKDERVAYTNLDLDGNEKGPKPSEVIEFLLTLGIDFMVTPGSGTEGKFRVLIRHDRSYTIAKLHELWKGIFAANGWCTKLGSIEIYPSTRNGRLPFGFNACVLFDPRDLTRSEKLSFDEMLSRFRQSKPCDLDELHAKFATNPLEFDDVREAWSIERSTVETNPTDDDKSSKHKGKPRELTPRERADVERYRTQGVEPGQRDYAISLLVKDDNCRGFTKSRTVDDLAQWVRDEKIARSNFAKEHGSGYIAKQIEDLPRRVRDLFAKYEKHKSPPRHLSVRDILNLAPHVERVAAKFGITVECAGKIPLRLLPRWKGYPDAIRIERGILTHCSIFEDAAGGRGDYAAIRDEFGFFRATSGYLPQSRAVDGKGQSTHYACDFPFDESSPAVPLARTWIRSFYLATLQDKLSHKAR